MDPQSNPQTPDPKPQTPADPAAASAVIANARSAREVQLEKDLADERAKVKQREVEAAEAQDRYESLKKAMAAPPTTPPPPKTKRSGLRPIIHLDDEE